MSRVRPRTINERSEGSPMSDQIEVFVEVEQEADGRWLAEVPDLPGVLAYGSTADEAASRAQILAEQVLSERLQEGEAKA